jgi:hypothetical protein
MRANWKLCVGIPLLLFSAIAELGAIASGNPIGTEFILVITSVCLILWHYINKYRRDKYEDDD